MSEFLSRRAFCASSMLIPAALWLPGCGGGGSYAAAPNAAPLLAPGALDTPAAAQWAGIALRAVAAAPAPGLPPFISARVFAMAFLAAHDALNAIQPAYGGYLALQRAPGANAEAAVAAAVHGVLVHELPFAQAMVDAEYAAAITAIVGGGSLPKGVATGQASAAAMLEARDGDGIASIDGPFVEGTAAGEYRFTPPFDFAAAVRFGELRSFAIASAAAYRPPAPYRVTDAAYTADYDEVKAYGSIASMVRSADQSEVAKFWLENTDAGWLRIALQIGAARRMPGWTLMRTLALVAAAQTDAYIANIAAKYHYHFWRPVTAIRLGASDGNPATVGDAGWTSFDPVCPPVPDYPSGHSASAGAGEAVLRAAFGGDAASFSHDSASLPGITRSYTSFSQTALEICNSRIWVGYHFRLATTAGRAQGQQVGSDVMARLLPLQS